MEIIVCIKQVPETTDVKIDPETNTLIREGVASIINPFDTYAIEEGVRLKERFGGKVTAISMGPPQAESALREAISLGVDEGILLSDPAFAGADTWATSYTLSAAISRLGYDIVVCGRQTLDGDTGQVSPQLAEMLDVPFVALHKGNLFSIFIDTIENGEADKLEGDLLILSCCVRRGPFPADYFKFPFGIGFHIAITILLKAKM